jgi:thiamine pyrophosphokinase
MEKVIFVIAGGSLGDPSFLRERAAAVMPAAVICADGGSRHLRATGIAPTLIIGDMDSLDATTEKRYREMGARIIRHPQQKDETDTELALGEAFAMAPAEVWIWGSMGYRIDHTLANVSLLVRGVERGVAVKLIDSWCEVFLVARRAILDGQEGQTVSLLPFWGEASGVTLRGFEYPLTKATMSPGHPHGISNVLTAKRGTIDVDAGFLLAVRYFRPGAFPEEVMQ